MLKTLTIWDTNSGEAEKSVHSVNLYSQLTLLAVSMWNQVWLSQSVSSQDCAQTQKFIVIYPIKLYFHCTKIMSACETLHVSQEDKIIVQ